MKKIALFIATMMVCLGVSHAAIKKFTVESTSPGRVVVSGTLDAETDGSISAQIPSSTRAFTASKNGTGVYRITLDKQYPGLISANATLEGSALNAGYTVYMSSDQSATANKYVEFTVYDASTGGGAVSGTVSITRDDESTDFVNAMNQAGVTIHSSYTGNGKYTSGCDDASAANVLSDVSSLLDQFGNHILEDAVHNSVSHSGSYAADTTFCSQADALTDLSDIHECMGAFVYAFSLHSIDAGRHNGLSSSFVPGIMNMTGLSLLDAIDIRTICGNLKTIIEQWNSHINGYQYTTGGASIASYPLSISGGGGGTGSAANLTTGALHFNIVLRDSALDY